MDYINSHLGIFILIGGVIAFFFIFKRFLEVLTGKLPYIKQPTGLFSNAEKKFYHMLQKSLDYKFKIFAKVRVADLIAVAPHVSGPGVLRAFNRISRKHVDYVICDKGSLEVLAVVELDDSSHLRKDRIDRDKFVDKAFHSAGIPIIHIKAQGHYDLRMLAMQISDGIYKN